MTFKVGDIVVATKQLISDDEFYGAYVCAQTDEKLVIAEIRSIVSYNVHKASISMPSAHDIFYVGDDELELVRGIDEDLSNLAYSIIIDELRHDQNWAKVEKILRLFKQKKHQGFYLEVEERDRGRGFKIRVFRE